MPKKTLPFYKMHGAGNDFVFVSDDMTKTKITSVLAKKLLDRHFGVGGDQLLYVRKNANGASKDARASEARYTLDIWNADGSRAEMCGNGARAVAYYLRDRKGERGSFKMMTGAGLIGVGQKAGRIEIDMGEPILDGKKIPTGARGEIIDFPLQVGDRSFRIHAVSMGNPHAVVFMKNLDAFALHSYGPQMERHPFFPRRVNAHFVEVLSRKRLKARVWERGAGQTLACGTGACAIAVAAARAGLAEREVDVDLPGGRLHVRWGADNHVYLSGPAETVYKGEFQL
jgi:diaminopimelate epimerase